LAEVAATSRLCAYTPDCLRRSRRPIHRASRGTAVLRYE
jgi:hypothetical protein